MQRMLFVSQAIPRRSGGGLAMRAWATAMAFAQRYELHLLVIDHHLTIARQIDPALQARCANAVVLPPEATPAEIAAFVPASVDIVHYFRLSSFQMRDRIEPALTTYPDIWLDLDDIESRTQRRIEAVARLRGDLGQAETAESAALVAEWQEHAAIFVADRIFVCSTGDSGWLEVSGGAEIVVLPNTLSRDDPLPQPAIDEPFTILFLGSLQYLPNLDGLRWFAESVWPLLRASSPVSLRLIVAGTGITPVRLGPLQDDPDVEAIRHPGEVRPLYARSHAVIVPLRSGGGTRIKAIEAFNFGRPVVGTSIGLEGLDIEHDRQALIADDPDAFVDALLRLIQSRETRDQLVREARRHFLARFESVRLDEIVGGWA